MYAFLAHESEGVTDLMKSLTSNDGTSDAQTSRSAKAGLNCLGSNRDGQAPEPRAKAMGMATAFDPDLTDFSRIRTPPPSLFISDVQHETYVKVDEEGTEAAAATSVTVAATSATIREPAPFEMIVDHPFYFAISERQSGAMLFTGIMIDPTKSWIPTCGILHWPCWKRRGLLSFPGPYC
jgi:serine protease inhibitor